jgi:hypothetical protein
MKLTSHLARRWRPGLLALVIAGLAGCSSGTPPSGPGSTAVASLPGSGRHAAARGPAFTSAQGDQDMLDFTRCMRAHGVARQDPYHRPGHAGLTLDLPPTPAPAATRARNHFIAPIAAATAATTGYAAARHASAEVPAPVLAGAVAAALLIGVLAGLYPAGRAARLAPAEALRIL